MNIMRDKYDLIAPAPGERFTGDALIAALQGADIFAPLFFDSVDATLISALPERTKLIVSYGVGTNHIDIAAATARGIQVANTPDVVTDDTADLAIGLMIAAGRRFYTREQQLRRGQWNNQDYLSGLGRKITGKTLGIVGMGRIGQAVARRAAGFDMSIIYHARSRKPKAENSVNMSYRADLDSLLREADFISLHTPLTDDTHHMIGARELDCMKSTAILINTGRGPLVHEADLVTALKTGQIAGAGLDVYEFEPRLAAGMATLENVTILPHIGTATIETRDDMAMRVIANIDQFCHDGTLLDPVTS